MHLPGLFVCIELESWEFLLVDIVRVDSALSRFFQLQIVVSKQVWRLALPGWAGEFMFFPFTGEFLYIVGLKEKWILSYIQKACDANNTDSNYTVVLFSSLYFCQTPSCI